MEGVMEHKRGPRPDNRVSQSYGALEQFVKRCEARPDEEHVLTRHASIDSARARVQQMRRSAKWGPLPVTFRAASLPEDEWSPGCRAVIVAKWSGVYGAGGAVSGEQRTVRRLVTSRMDVSAVEEFVQAFVDGKDWVVPDGTWEEVLLPPVS